VKTSRSSRAALERSSERSTTAAGSTTRSSPPVSSARGRAPSLIAIVTGLALIELARPRRSKSLPRQFVLAVTGDRVAAFKASGGGDSESNYELRIKPGELGWWPRDLVRLADPETLDLAGERIPVARANLNGDSSTDELIALLSS
jgi:hypothetical protein